MSDNMAREMYASDGVITLYPLAEEDRAHFFTLRKQCSDMPKSYEDADFCEKYWKKNTQSDHLDFSVYDAAGEYCGNLELQKPESAHPEIGIELLEEKRYRGIGGRAVKLLAKTDYADRQPVYYLLTVTSDNTASIRMIEKLGAVRTDEVLDKVQEQSNILRMILSLECGEELRKQTLSYLQRLQTMQVYHFLPEHFLE